MARPQGKHQPSGVGAGLVTHAITLKALARRVYNCSKRMPSPKALNPQLVRTQLEKILCSAGFVRNDRLSGFLRFVVEQELSGRADELKESVIGVEFFGRQAAYDVRQDSVVRNEAAKLRSRLAEYYVAE